MATLPNSSNSETNKQTKISLTPSEEHHEDLTKLSDRIQHKKFSAVVLCTFLLMFIMEIIRCGISHAVEIQTYSWSNKFGINSTIYSQMTKTINIYDGIAMLSFGFCFAYAAGGLRGMIKLFRATKWSTYIIIFLFSIGFTYGFQTKILPSTTVHTFVDQIFQNNDSYFLVHNSSLSTIDNSLCMVPNSIIYWQFLSIITIIQNTIIFMIYVIHRPKNFDLLSDEDYESLPSFIYNTPQKPKLVRSQSETLLKLPI